MTKNIQRLKNNIYDFIFQFVKLSRVKPKIIKALDLDAISRKNLLEAREGLELNSAAVTHKIHLNTMSFKHAFVIGLIQCFAFIPGVSRSAATIIGGVLLGLDKKHATEFSFFLALPTLAGATLIKTIKVYPTINQSQIFSLVLGVSLSFAFAILAIRSFVALVSSRKGIFQWFGVYRILLGSIILFI